MYYLFNSINDYRNDFFENNDNFPSSLLKIQEYDLDTNNQFNSINEEEQLDNNKYHLII